MYMVHDTMQNASRRDVLRVAGGTAASAGVMGLASATPPGTVEVNVGVTGQNGARAARAEADDVVREFDFDALTIRVAREAVSGLERRPDVRYVEENGTMEALAQTVPYGIDRVDADVAINNGNTGDGVDLAILDTGIDSDHPSLQGILGSGKAFAQCKGGPKSCRFAWDDDEGHGTHCAGTAAAVDNNNTVVGVAPGVTLHSVKVLDKRGSGSYSDIAAGIEYTANQGWDVGSMSLGGGKSAVVEDACEFAASQGTLLVAAAGNSGPCSSCVGYPAAEPEVIAVSATDSTDSLASFSSVGPEVELAAPGVEVVSTKLGGGTEVLSGTSMSCPHVAGAAAQVIGATGATASDARSTLKNNAEDVGLASDEQGAGLVDVASALGLSSTDDL